MQRSQVAVRVLVVAAVLAGAAPAVEQAFKRGALEANTVVAVKKFSGLDQEAD